MKLLKLPIVLVGPMGVGKSTVGKKLAHQLNVPFIDTDAVIVKQHGDIPGLFAKFGEAHFRKLESDALTEALKLPAVVATGGGVVLSDQNRERLKEVSCIYLATNGKHQANRLKGGNRPLLQNGMDDWTRIYDERRALYEEVSKLTIDTSNLPLKVIVKQLEEAML